MNLIPSVSEYDLYLFVFHPEKIGDEKREYIAGNEKFEESISHFRELATSVNEDISESDRNLILSKISVYMPNDRIFFCILLNPDLIQRNSQNSSTVLPPWKWKRVFLQKPLWTVQSTLW